MKWFWGTVLIILGLIILGINTNTIDRTQLSQIANLWPLLLILYGSILIFHRYKFGWIITLLVFLGSIGLIAAVINGNITYKTHTGKRQTHKFSENLKDTTQEAKITINSGAVDLNISTSNNKLIEGQLTSNFLNPNLKVNYNDTLANVTLNTESSFDYWPKGKNDFDVKITDQIPTKLTLNVGASKIDANLSKILLEKLEINSGASDINVRLGDNIRNNADINFSSGASSIKLSIPKSIGISVRNQSPISSFDFENSKKIDTKTYQSENFDQADKKVNVDISSGASSIQIDTY